LLSWNGNVAHAKLRNRYTYTSYRQKQKLTRLNTRRTRRINRNSGEIYNIEHRVYGCQETAYKILRELNKTEKDKMQLNPVSEGEVDI
jgi:hypothetical protein